MNESAKACPFPDGRQVYDYSPGDPEQIADPHAFLRMVRAETPLFYSSRHDGFWALTRYTDVMAATRDGERFSSAVVGVTMPQKIYERDHPYIPVETDDPEHAEYRSVIAPLLTRSAVRRLEPKIAEIVEDLLAKLEELDTADLVQQFALPMVSQVLMHAMGMPAQDAPRVVDVAMRIFHGRVNDPELAAEATAEFNAYLRTNIERHRRAAQEDPTDDEQSNVFSRLVSAKLRDGRRLDEWELHMFAANIFTAGFETTINALGSVLWYLSTDLSTRRRIGTEPEIMDSAVEEFLRYFTPVQLFGRNAKRDMELHGQTIGKGEAIFLHYGSANRDENVFTDPDVVDIARHPNRHLAFGSGIHFCMGAQLARAELRIALRMFLERFPNYGPLRGVEPEWNPSADQRGLWRLPVVLRETGASA